MKTGCDAEKYLISRFHCSDSPAKMASYITSNMLSPPICQEQYKHYETNGDRSPEKNHTLFAYPTLARLAKEGQNIFEVANTWSFTWCFLDKVDIFCEDFVKLIVA